MGSWWPELWSEVAIPLWVVVVMACLAGVALIDWLFGPLARAIYARHRQARIEALNERLRLAIPPFKTERRQALVSRILLDPEVEAAILEDVRAKGEPVGVVRARARRYAREIVPAFSATFYFRVGTRLARALSTYLYRVRLGASDRARLTAVESGATVVFVINHRSNMDYVLVTYLASGSSALSYAVGEWARVPGLERVIRLMGGYFIRRDSGNQLYRRVLASYVRTATQSGVTQAVFPEGGLTRTGALQRARLGLLAYMVGAFDPAGPRDLLFVPVGLNYDRVLEDRILTAAAATPKGERPRFAFRLPVFLGFLARNLLGRLVGRWYRYGYACVSFGTPVSLRQHLAERRVDLRVLGEEDRFREIAVLGERLIAAVGASVPALPVSLVAQVMLEAGGRPLSRLELKGRVHELVRTLSERGAEVYIPRADREYAVDVGIRMLVLRRLVVERDGLLSEGAGARDVLAFYANAIVHHLARPPWPVPAEAAAEGSARAPTIAAGA